MSEHKNSTEEGLDWLDLANKIDELMAYIPVEHFADGGIQSDSIYADVYPALEKAQKEIEAIAGKKLRWGRS